MNKATKKKELRNYSIDFGVCIFCGNCVEYCPTNCLSMTEEYELASFDRHSLNFDNVALGRLPTNVTTDPAVVALRELAYLPKGRWTPMASTPIARGPANCLSKLRRSCPKGGDQLMPPLLKSRS